MPLADRAQKRPRQHRHLAWGGEQVTAVAIVERQRVRHVVIGEEILQAADKLLVVFEEHAQSPGPEVVLHRKQRCQLLALPRQAPPAPGKEQGGRPEPGIRQKIIDHAEAGGESGAENGQQPFRDRQEDLRQRIAEKIDQPCGRRHGKESQRQQ